MLNVEFDATIVRTPVASLSALVMMTRLTGSAASAEKAQRSGSATHNVNTDSAEPCPTEMVRTTAAAGSGDEEGV